MQHGVSPSVETLNSLIQVKYQTTKASPFDSHDVIMSVLLVAYLHMPRHRWPKYAPSSRITLLHPSGNLRLFAGALRHIASIFLIQFGSLLRSFFKSSLTKPYSDPDALAAISLLAVLDPILGFITSAVWTCLFMAVAYESRTEIRNILSLVTQMLIDLFTRLIARGRTREEQPNSHVSRLLIPVRFFSPFNRAVTVRMALPLSAQSPVVEQQKVTTSNKHGEKLVGLLHDTGSNDIVILCHGLCSTKEDDIMVNLAKALEKEGISVFRFDFAGNGESEGSFSFGNYRREADDLRAVIEHFRRSSNPKQRLLPMAAVVSEGVDKVVYRVAISVVESMVMAVVLLVPCVVEHKALNSSCMACSNPVTNSLREMVGSTQLSNQYMHVMGVWKHKELKIRKLFDRRNQS
uniref:Serine aminopeptidase S33 domain-containing protein n=1 Tax=Salix viminalis TaxID=40686 RepID=A0A6N2LWR8_SALVM